MSDLQYNDKQPEILSAVTKKDQNELVEIDSTTNEGVYNINIIQMNCAEILLTKI